MWKLGGDQWSYLQDWSSTPLQRTVQDAIDKRSVPIGGTSAGCDIQSWYIWVKHFMNFLERMKKF